MIVDDLLIKDHRFYIGETLVAKITSLKNVDPRLRVHASISDFAIKNDEC